MHLFELKELLCEGDLRSDGLSDDVVKIILENPGYFGELVDCLYETNDKIRAHASDALEKILRLNTELINPYLNDILSQAQQEQLSIVKMHFAMIFGYLWNVLNYLDEIIKILFSYLADTNAFVVSWTISSLTIIACNVPEKKTGVIKRLKIYPFSSSKAVQTRLQKALFVLEKNGRVPKSWIKKTI